MGHLSDDVGRERAALRPVYDADVQLEGGWTYDWPTGVEGTFVIRATGVDSYELVFTSSDDIHFQKVEWSCTAHWIDGALRVDRGTDPRITVKAFYPARARLHVRQLIEGTLHDRVYDVECLIADLMLRDGQGALDLTRDIRELEKHDHVYRRVPEAEPRRRLDLEAALPAAH